MKRLLWLYPRAWRARYQAEVRALLEATPGGWRDALDLIVGAIDARLYPQTAGYGGRRWTRALGVVCLAALGGLLLFALDFFRFPGAGVFAGTHFLVAVALSGGVALVSRMLGARLAAWFFGAVALRYGLSLVLSFLPIIPVVSRMVGFRMVVLSFPLHILVVDAVGIALWTSAVTLLLGWSGVRWRSGLAIALGLELLVMSQDFWMIVAHPISPWYWQLVSALQHMSGRRGGYPALALLVGIEAMQVAVWAAVIAAIATRRSRRPRRPGWDWDSRGGSGVPVRPRPDPELPALAATADDPRS